MTVNVPPVISTQPASQLISVSNNVTFSVTLSQGSAPLSYQWKYGGANIAGATNSSYTVSSVKWSSAGNYSVAVTNAAGSVTSSNAVLTVQQAAFTWTDAFETYKFGVLDQNYSTGPNTNSAVNPWWGNVPPNLYVYRATNGVTPHSGTNMVGGSPGVKSCRDFINLPFRMNAGQKYYGNIRLDWWFYDPYGTNATGTNFSDYVALAQYDPVSLTNDFVTTSFTNVNQRMSLGAYNVAGFTKTNYQARIVGATGFTNGWFNTVALRSVGWHHARIVVGIPTGNNAPVQMFIDNMSNATFSYTNSGGTNGFNLIELNANVYSASNGGYYDDISFQSANDPWIAQQPSSLTVSAGSSATFTTVAVGTAYQWQFNGANIAGATSSIYTLTNAQPANAGNYTCIVTGANGTVTTSAATLTVQ